MFKHRIDMENILKYDMLEDAEFFSVGQRIKRSIIEQLLNEGFKQIDGETIDLETELEVDSQARCSQITLVNDKTVKCKHFRNTPTNNRRNKSDTKNSYYTPIDYQRVESKAIESQNASTDDQRNDSGTFKDVSSKKSKIKDISDNQKEQEKKKPNAEEDKAKKLRRKLKKQRQKERKKNEKLSANDNNEDTKEDKGQTDSIKDSESVTSNLDNHEEASEQGDLSIDDENKDVEGINENEELDLLTNVPAFVSVALKKSNKKSVNTKQDKANTKVYPVESNDTTNEEDNAVCTNYTDYHSDNDNESFTFVKGKRTRQISENRESPEFIGAKAVKLIMKNKIQAAVKRLSEAIEQDPYNVYHYVNRGFCYLRLKEYSLAREDAQHVLLNCQNKKIILKAKCILSQAFFGMKNYEDAEQNLEECLKLAPNSFHFQQELTRFRLTQLTSFFGFSEKDAIHALKGATSILTAIDVLVEKGAGSTEDTDDTSDPNTFDENEIYYSDDDDENDGSVEFQSVTSDT